MAGEGVWVQLRLRISGGVGNYRVDAACSDKRVPPANEALSLTPEELTALRNVQVSLVAQADAASRDARPVRLLPSAGTVPLDVEEFSRTLTSKVFVGGVGRAFIQAATLAPNVAVSVEVQPNDLAGLPWEFLRDPNGVGAPFLAKEHCRRLTRANAVAGPVRLGRSKPVVLAVAVSAAGQPLDFREEREALEKLEADGFIELQWLTDEKATYDGVNDALRGGRVQVFHFAGHGDFAGGDARGEIVLHDGPLTADRLATLFGGSGVQFAFLNSCQGATIASADAFAGTAQRLAAAGVPAVLAMQHIVLDQVAGGFARKFYERLADGESVSTAVNSVRLAFSGPAVPPDAWATPVLYLNGEDGLLIEKPPALRVELVAGDQQRVTVGDAAPVVLRVTNSGGGTLSWRIDLTALQGAEAVAVVTSGTLAQGASQEVTVNLTPRASGHLALALAVAADGATQSPGRVTVAMDALQPRLAVGPIAPLGTPHVRVGRRVTFVVPIHDTGEGTLRWAVAQREGGPGPTVTRHDDRVEITLVAVVGPHTWTFTISSNGGNEEIALSVYGVSLGVAAAIVAAGLAVASLGVAAYCNAHRCPWAPSGSMPDDDHREVEVEVPDVDANVEVWDDGPPSEELGPRCTVTESQVTGSWERDGVLLTFHALARGGRNYSFAARHETEAGPWEPHAGTGGARVRPDQGREVCVYDVCAPTSTTLVITSGRADPEDRDHRPCAHRRLEGTYRRLSIRRAPACLYYRGRYHDACPPRLDAGAMPSDPNCPDACGECRQCR
jgi:hypothetical protein